MGVWIAAMCTDQVMPEGQLASNLASKLQVFDADAAKPPKQTPKSYEITKTLLITANEL